MHGKKNIKRACKTGGCFLPFISWFFQNRMMGIMFELKTEELRVEGYIMWRLVICTACQVVGN